MKILQNKKLLVGIFLIIVVAASGGTYYYLNQQKPTPFEQKTEMPKFKSCDSFIKAYKEGSKRSSGPLMMESAPGSANKSAPLAAEGRGGGSEAPEHSETNIQVAGVDEADIVKNDGKYIYTGFVNRVGYKYFFQLFSEKNNKWKFLQCSIQFFNYKLFRHSTDYRFFYFTFFEDE